MDQTKRPLAIPPQFAVYAEKYCIFKMFEEMLSGLIIEKPEDPLEWMINALRKDSGERFQVMVLGPPCSGKKSLAKMVSSKLRTAFLTPENLIEEAEKEQREQAKGFIKRREPIPIDLWMEIIDQRLKVFDCVKKGWVMAGFPQTREQALAMQVKGIFPNHVVILKANDTVLIERAIGKRLDPRTGNVYHITFDPPSDPDVFKRLQQVPGCDEKSVIQRLVIHHRHIDNILNCFKTAAKEINADQPKADVFSEVSTFISSSLRSAEPRNPRVVLLGPTGSGKSVQASLLANKYNVVNVSCGQIIKQAIADGTKQGLACKPYVEKDLLVPDAIILKILLERLCQLDCATRGWVLHGYPRTREQAEQLAAAGYAPNRVFFMDVPNDSVMERLTQRATDPVTGERYHLLYNPPRTVEIKDRLQLHPRDAEDCVKKRVSQYGMFADELADYFEQAQRVNADQDPHTVFENIESLIVLPLPKRLVII